MKIGPETVEIKPRNIEDFSAEVKWKSGINVTKVEQLIDGLSSESREKSITDLENVCNKIIESKDSGLREICEKKFGIDIFRVGVDAVHKYILDTLENIKAGDDSYIDIIKDFIMDYKVYYYSQYEKALSYIEETRTDFVDIIEQTSSQYGVSIDIEKVKLLVEKTSVSFLDGTYFGEDFDLTGEKHSTSGELYIGLDSFSSRETFRHVYFHELLHVISTDYSKVIHVGPRNNPIDTQSTGFDYSGNFESRSRGFVWLNEAFTDVFSVVMVNSGNKGELINPRYKKEITLIKLLSEKGNVNLFEKMYGVYFRHIKKDSEISPVDDWRQFSKELDTVFGPRFLVKLDIFIEKHGVDKAIETIQKRDGGELVLDSVE